MTKFFEGDWVLFEHKVGQIKETEEDRITCISDGSFEIASRDLSNRVFPMTLAGKSVTDWFDFYYHELHREDRGGKLNWPDLSRYIVDLWVGVMQVLEDEDKKKVLLDKSSSFFREVKEELAKLRDRKTADGLKLFR